MSNGYLRLSGVTDEYNKQVQQTGYLAVADLRTEDVVAVESEPARVAWANVFALVNVSQYWVAGEQPYRTIVIMQDNRVFKLIQSIQRLMTLIEDQRLLKLDAHIRKLIAPALGLHRNLPYVTGDLCLVPVTPRVRSNNSWVHWQSDEMNWNYRQDGTMLTKEGCVPLLWAVSDEIIKRRIRDCSRLVSFLQSYGQTLRLGKLGHEAIRVTVSPVSDVQDVDQRVTYNWAMRVMMSLSQQVEEKVLSLALREIQQGDYSKMPEV